MIKFFFIFQFYFKVKMVFVESYSWSGEIVEPKFNIFLVTVHEADPIACNVCVCDVAGFRSRALSAETKRWFYKNTKI